MPAAAIASSSPTRRELLFGAGGLGLGVLFTSAYYISSDYASPTAVADVVEALLDDPRFVEAVADDALLLSYGGDALDKRVKTALAKDLEASSSPGDGGEAPGGSGKK
jgi:hypothetical protein